MAIRSEPNPAVVIFPAPAHARLGAGAARPATLTASEAAWIPARRLVVLVPAELESETALAAYVLELARARGLEVLYLGLAPDPEDEPQLQRRLALLAAHTWDNRAVQADYRLVVGGTWLAWLPQVCAPGDLVVCHREQRLWRGWRVLPLAEALAARLGRPVVELEGHAVRASLLTGPARTAIFWLGAVLLMAFFFWVQVDIASQARAWAQTVLLAGSVLAELAALAVWNRWLS
jgi:hypothetical protein